jgi:molecular chaperone Hsp33
VRWRRRAAGWTSLLAAVALGRALTAAVLLQRISFKVPSRLVLEISGDGPLGKVLAEADTAGALRGLVGKPQIPTPEDGRMKIAPAIGRGFLRVTREGEKRYTSQVELVSGELGDDLTHFLEQSEQIRSAVLLGVLPRPLGIAAAGGLIVEALPGTEESVLQRIERNIRTLDGVSAALDRGGIDALLAKVLRGLDREVNEYLPLEYRCRCSRESLLGKLRPLAARDLASLIDETGKCLADCAYCGSQYLFSADELGATN